MTDPTDRPPPEGSPDASKVLAAFAGEDNDCPICNEAGDGYRPQGSSESITIGDIRRALAAPVRSATPEPRDEMAKLAERLQAFVRKLRNDDGYEDGDFDMLDDVETALYAASLDPQHVALAYAGLCQMLQFVNNSDGLAGINVTEHDTWEEIRAAGLLHLFDGALDALNGVAAPSVPEARGTEEAIAIVEKWKRTFQTDSDNRSGDEFGRDASYIDDRKVDACCLILDDLRTALRPSSPPEPSV